MIYRKINDLRRYEKIKTVAMLHVTGSCLKWYKVKNERTEVFGKDLIIYEI